MYMPQIFGNYLASWTVLEYDHHVRSGRWYIIGGTIAFGLLIYSVLTFNILFALIIILTTFIIYLQSRVHTQEVQMAITTRGVQVGSKLYQYTDLAKFWIVYATPDVKKLYLSFKSAFLPELMIPLRNQNPIKIREILTQFLEEDLEKEEEPASETLTRIAKL